MVQTSRIQLDLLTQFQDELRRLFKNFLERSRASQSMADSDILPQADVYESNSAVIVEVELPGLKINEIDVSISKDLIVVEGRKKESSNSETKKANFLCMEREFGRFRRIIEIPIPGDTNKIEAKLKDGILRISIPKLKDRRSSRKKVAVSEQ